MPRDYRLICRNGEWMVASKARRIRGGQEVIVWVYGKERAEFCDVGQESDVLDLPEQKPYVLPDVLYHGTYPWEIDVRYEFSLRWETVAGGDNMVMVSLLYEEWVRYAQTNQIVRWRFGGRIQNEERGTWDHEVHAFSPHGPRNDTPVSQPVSR